MRYPGPKPGPGIRVIARHGVEPVAGGTRVTLSIEYTGLLGPLIAWLNRRYLALEAAGLKRRSEASR
jgi:hypothetical protein